VRSGCFSLHVIATLAFVLDALGRRPSCVNLTDQYALFGACRSALPYS
jgi:hypothetical protein